MVPTPKAAASVWNSLEIAKLFVAVLTPIVVAALGVYFARSAESRARMHAQAQDRSALLQRIPRVVTEATAYCVGMVVRRTIVQALLQLQIDHPDWPQLEANLNEAQELYQRDQDTFRSATSELNEVAIAADFMLGPSISAKLQEAAEFLQSLLTDETHVTSLRTQIIETYSTPTEDIALQSLLVQQAMAKHLAPAQNRLNQIKSEIVAAARSELAA